MIELRKVAFGPLNLNPNEFWELTPAEIFALCDGYKERMDKKMELNAWHAANVMNVHLKKPISIDKLLARGKYKSAAPHEKLLQQEKLKQLLLERGMNIGR